MKTPQRVVSLFLLILVVTAGAWAADTPGTQLDLHTYCLKQMECSDALRTATDRLAAAEKALNQARRDEAAALYVEEKAGELEVAHLRLQETRASEVAVAAQLYCGVLAAGRDVAAAREALAIAEETLKIKKLRFEAGVITQAEVAQVDNAVFTARDAERTVLESQASAVRAFCLAAGLPREASLIPQPIVTHTDDAELGLEEVLAAAKTCNPDLHTVQNRLLLARRRDEAMRSLTMASASSAAEKKQAAEELAEAVRQADRAVAALEEAVRSLLARYSTLRRQMEINDNQIRLAGQALEAVKLRLSYGEVLPIDVENARFDLDRTLDRAASLVEELLVVRIKLAGIRGADPLALLTPWHVKK